METPHVAVAVARLDERAALANLMQLYVHDFSDFWSGTSNGDLRDDGRFEDYPLDPYWRDEGQMGDPLSGPLSDQLSDPVDDQVGGKLSGGRAHRHVPLLVRRDGALIGFALLNTSSHSGQSVDRNMAEFFIARKHRRGGVGTAAAREIFARFPGVWEAAVARRNGGALAFWRAAVSGCPGADEIVELDVSTPAWNGPILRFRIPRV